MKTWKDKTILGAIAGSEKFKCINEESEEKHILGIKGAYFVLDMKTNEVVHTKLCKLIARHVDSITDEEWKILNDNGYASYNGRYWSLLDRAGLYFEVLKFGVLPESLADEDVIWESKDD